jgi:tRNA pseudouridine38-40 synthase
MGTVRTVYKVDLIEEGNGNYRVDFLLKGALYKMVRNMMGTALDVSKGRMEEETLIDLLNRTEDDVRNNNRCKPAPPEGLCLERVFFPDEF